MNWKVSDDVKNVFGYSKESLDDLKMCLGDLDLL